MDNMSSDDSSDDNKSPLSVGCDTKNTSPDVAIEVEKSGRVQPFNSVLRQKSNEDQISTHADTGVMRKQSHSLDHVRIAEEFPEMLDIFEKGKKQDKMTALTPPVQNCNASGTSSGLQNAKSLFRRGVTGSMSIPMNKTFLKLYGSEKAVLEEQQRLQRAGKWIIHPYSNFRFIWDTLTLIVLLGNIILIPVAISFWKDGNAAWLPFKAISDVWFLADIIFNFRTGIVIDGPDSEIILDPEQIRVIYLKTWFAIDVISTFPFDLLFTVADDSASFHAGSSIKAFSLLRLTKILSLLRLLRLSRLIRYMKQWEEIFNFQYEMAIAFARILNLILLMLFICHFNGCLQYMVPMFLDFPEKTWVRERNLHLSNVSAWERYSWSVFKSTSHMLCIGYGQFPPKGLIDVWVTYVSMCSGAMCFALFIGNATSLIQSMDASKRAYKEKYMQVKEYMQFRKLPADLRHRIADYYENRFQGKMFDESRILSELNHTLREEVINYNCRDLVDQVPFFYDADPNFVTAILEKLQFEVFLTDEIIVREGTIANKMYFINRGTISITSKQHNIDQCLSDGCYFGELALLEPHFRQVANITADTYCYLYSLSVEAFNEVLKEFPKQRAKIAVNKPRLLRGRSSNISQETFNPNTGSALSLDGHKERQTHVGSGLCEITEEPSEIQEDYTTTHKTDYNKA